MLFMEPNPPPVSIRKHTPRTVSTTDATESTYPVFFALMITLVVRIIIIATRTRRRYGSYICVGIAAILIAQTFENIGMCLAMLPVVGITLPLMSYGGSSVLSTYLMLGVIQSIASSTSKKKF